MSAPALDPVHTPSGKVTASPAKARGQQARATAARFDTALGWSDRPGPAWALRILLPTT
ncbi:hypothetical protein [Streptomyces sp. NPDC001480]|uniref:hypothetical protein n=1 Tax=Streptomyces sp. NPDC001480 TaxID=3364577 RepID=UPI0036CC486C